MKIQGNLKDASPKPVPACWYKACITGVRYKEGPKVGTYPMYEFTLLSEATSGDPTGQSTIGRKVFQGIYADWMMAKLYKAALALRDEELPGADEADDQDVLNHELLIEVTHETYTPDSPPGEPKKPPETRVRVSEFKPV
jgi:hypothetical protein